MLSCQVGSSAGSIGQSLSAFCSARQVLLFGGNRTKVFRLRNSDVRRAPRT